VVDYARMARTATRLIQQNGRAVTVLIANSGSLADANKPWEPTLGTPTEYDTFGVFDRVDDKFVDGTDVLMTDEMVLIAVDVSTTGANMPEDIELTAQDTVLDGDVPCAVVKSMPIRPGDTGVLLQAIVRRGR